MSVIKKTVVIPVYKETPEHNEIISFQRCLDILGNHPLTLISPQDLCLDNYTEIADKKNIKLLYHTFGTHFFSSISGYNQLMLTQAFYDRFSSYDYILIYQLDCYVFRDELEYWCKLGYDYIGSPWIIGKSPNTISRLKQKTKLLLNLPNNLYMNQFKVGNGGLSLRNPRKFSQIINKFKHKKRFEIYFKGNSYNYNEDMFWSFEVNRYYPWLRIPTWKKAIKFGFELNPDICFTLNNNILPFGCHAFEKSGKNFWQSYFSYETRTINETSFKE